MRDHSVKETAFQHGLAETLVKSLLLTALGTTPNFWIRGGTPIRMGSSIS
jgi:hypothetical protein